MAKKTPKGVIATLALALALALPASTLAATQSGTTPETLDIPATISMTVPASITYNQGRALNTQSVTVSNLSTDATGGLTLNVRVNGTGTRPIPLASRSFANVVGSAGLTSHTTNLQIGIQDTDWLAFSNGPVSGESITFDSRVDASAFAPGSWTGSMVFTASTN